MSEIIIQLVTAICLQEHPNMDLKKCQNLALDVLNNEINVAREIINGKND